MQGYDETVMDVVVPPSVTLQALGSALSALGLPVYSKDAAGRYLHLNEAAAEVLGLAGPAAALGRSDADFLAPSLARALRAADQAAQDNPSATVSDHVLDLPGGRREFMAVRSALDGGGLLGVWLEHSERSKLNAQLQQALTQLEEQQRSNAALRSEAEGRAQRQGGSKLVQRDQFDEHLNREIDLSLREHREFAVVYVSIDAAPEGSPQHGAGGRERIIDALGTLLRSNTRAMDAPSRLGDERFAVLLSGVGLATAHARMEQLRRQCATQLVAQSGDALRFTVSMGVASFPHTSQTRSALLQAADDALRQAQQRGGNHVALASISFGAESPRE